MASKEPLNTDQLGDRYDIIGELAGRSDAQTLLGNRKEDGLPVLIVVSRAPEGDEGNALSHLAADANLLSSLTHTNLLPVLEGRWLGTDAFATVLQRPKATAIDDLLSKRDEEFGFPRIADILGQANSVLEWARAQKVVHRSITPETLLVEPGSDRVLVSFAVRPLPLGGIPGAESDARSIAGLARAMFTRSTVAPERDAQPLIELRPGLPTRVVEDTEALLQPVRDGKELPDVSAYIAQIAMADAVKSGEVHVIETHRAMDEQQRLHREQIDKERREHEATIAKERATHEALLANERKEHARLVEEQTKKFQNERDDFERQLARERGTLEKAREVLTKERASHEEDRAALIAERDAHDREVGEVRERLEWETAALTTQRERYAHTAELPTPAYAMPVIISASPAPRPRPRAPARPAGPNWFTRVWHKRPQMSRSWTLAAAAALILVIGVTWFGLRGRHSTPPAALLTTMPGVRVVDSIAGGVVPVGALASPDSTPVSSARVDSTSEPTPPRRRSYFAPPELSAAARDSARRDSVARSDTIFGLPPALVPRDTVVKRESVNKPKPDSLVKRDSVPKADTLITRNTPLTKKPRG